MYKHPSPTINLGSVQWNPALGHLGNTVTMLLWSLVFGRPAKPTIHFLVKKPSLIQSPRYYGQFFWPIGDHIIGHI